MNYEEEAENYVVDTISSLKKQIKKLEVHIQILKDMIIDKQLSKLCWCDKCTEKRVICEIKKKMMRELDALIIVKELQNVKSKKNDV